GSGGALPAHPGAGGGLGAPPRRAAHEIPRLFRLPLFPNIGDPSFVASFSATVEALGVERMFSPRRRILVATGDVLDSKMAGPAIRAWHMASTLAREHEVRLVSTQACSLSHPDVLVSAVTDHEMTDFEAWCDAAIFQGNLMPQRPVASDAEKVVATDTYAPFHPEGLEQARGLDPAGRLLAVQSSTDVLNEQLRRGDF